MELAEVFQLSRDAFVSLGGIAGVVAWWRISRFWGGFEQRVSTALNLVAVLQKESKKYGETLAAQGAILASHTASLALLTAALTNGNGISLPPPPVPRSNGPLPSVDEFAQMTHETMPERYLRWAREGAERDRMRKEEESEQ